MSAVEPGLAPGSVLPGPGVGPTVQPSTPPGGADGSGPPPDEAPDGGGEGPAPARRKGRWIIELVAIVAVALVVAALLRAYVVQTFYIPSASMEPTLQIGDRILVDKLSYHLHGVHRGDIIVFKRPPLEDCGGAPVNDLVKRVVGLPGETVSLQGGQVYIDGKKLNEPWISSSVPTHPAPGDAPYNLTRPYRVPAGQYYLMGDNRPVSCDSRYWGPIPKSLIVGRVVVRVWPISHFKIF
jgi:signal peptidase I